MKKAKTKKTKTSPKRAKKQVEPKVVFKHKKLPKIKVADMGKYVYNETLATDEHGDPIVTQTVYMHGSKMLKCVIFDGKNNVVISKTYE